jgi:flagellar motor switch protein FliG
MGNLLKQGVNAYQQTINLKSKPHVALPEKQIPKQKQTEGLVKSTQDDKQKPQESKYRRVAKFLILIGSEQASSILAELDSEQIQEISKEISQIKVIKPEEAKEILAEFQAIFADITLRSPYRFLGSQRGGIEAARRILYAAKGPQKGEEILNRAVPESKENLFSFLEEFSPEQVAMLLKEESDQMAALIISRLSPKLSAGIIKKMPPARRSKIIQCTAYQNKISPEVLEQVSAAIKEKVRNVSGGASDIEVDGMQRLAEILKHGDYSFGDRIINELEESSPNVGKELKEKFYTLNDVILSIDRPLREKLAIMSDSDIAILLKGRDKEFKEKLLSCVSAGRRKLIMEEYEILGAVPRRDCDAVAIEFLDWFRTARERGEIILSSDEDVFL